VEILGDAFLYEKPRTRAADLPWLNQMASTTPSMALSISASSKTM